MMDGISISGVVIVGGDWSFCKDAGEVCEAVGWRPLTCAGAIFWLRRTDRHWFMRAVCYHYEFGLSRYLYLATSGSTPPSESASSRAGLDKVVLRIKQAPYHHQFILILNIRI